MLFDRQKLFIECSPEASELTLAEALVGGVGTLRLGVNGVRLWSPNFGAIPEGSEAVCDLRYDPLTDGTAEHFKRAVKGLFLPAKVAVFQGRNQEKIEQALEHFDYVFVPGHYRKIKNLPQDFRKRVLGYKAPEKGRCEPHLEDY